MKKTILIEPHYCGSLEYFTLLLSCDKVILEVNDHYIKQTFRNRCYVLGSGSTELLSVPVNYKNHTPTKDVTIDYDQSWLKDHKRAIESYYRNSPFFDYFWDLLSGVWDKKPKFLIELNHDFLTLCLKIMQLDISIDYTDEFVTNGHKEYSDLRNTVIPKKGFENREIYRPQTYTQLFGNNFVPNLSVIDLILCEGSRSTEILRKSIAQK